MVCCPTGRPAAGAGLLPQRRVLCTPGHVAHGRLKKKLKVLNARFEPDRDEGTKVGSNHYATTIYFVYLQKKFIYTIKHRSAGRDEEHRNS